MSILILILAIFIPLAEQTRLANSPTMNEKTPRNNTTDIKSISLVMMYAGRNSTWKDGISNLISAELAASDFRSRGDSEGNLKVNIIPFDGNCSSYLMPDKFEELSGLLKRPEVKGVIGPECSHHSNGVVSFFAHPFFLQSGYQKPFLTPSATSRDSFYLGPGESQLFAQLVPRVQQTQALSVKIAHKFNWRRFGVLHSMQTLPWVKTLEEVMEGGLVASVIQQDGLSPKAIRRQLQVFLDHDIHVFFLLLTSDWEVLCLAAEMGLMGGSNVWFVDAWLWHIIKAQVNQSCTPEQIQLVYDSNPLIDVQEWSKSENSGGNTRSGFSSSQIIGRIGTRLAQMDIKLPASRNPSWDLLAYDCVWLMSLAVEAVQSRCGITTTTSDSTATASPLDECKGEWADLVFGQMHRIEFEGVSGRVGLEDYQTKYPQVRAFYFQNWTDARQLLTAREDEVILKEDFDWRDWKNSTQILDHTVRVEVVRRNETEQIGLVMALCGNSACLIMTVLCVALLVFNFHFRNQKLIKMTSPTINNLILLGSILIYTSTVLSSASAFTTDRNILSVCCRVELCLVSLGFTLGYGSLFSKTWRIYKIFTDRGTKSGGNVRVRDQQLLMFVLGFTCCEVLFLLLWMFVSPLGLQENMGSIERVIEKANVDGDEGAGRVLEIQWISVQCVSQMTVFPYLFITIKAFVLLYGAFLAYETRHVHIEELNDSRSIGISIYNTIILSGFGLLASFAVKSDSSMHYLLLTAIKVFCVAITICVIFLPKIAQLYKDPEGKNLNVTRRLTAGPNTLNGHTMGKNESKHHKLSHMPSEIIGSNPAERKSNSKSDNHPKAAKVQIGCEIEDEIVPIVETAATVVAPPSSSTSA